MSKLTCWMPVKLPLGRTTLYLINNSRLKCKFQYLHVHVWILKCLFYVLRFLMFQCSKKIGCINNQDVWWTSVEDEMDDSSLWKAKWQIWTSSNFFRDTNVCLFNTLLKFRGEAQVEILFKIFMTDFFYTAAGELLLSSRDVTYQNLTVR